MSNTVLIYPAHDFFSLSWRSQAQISDHKKRKNVISHDILLSETYCTVLRKKIHNCPVFELVNPRKVNCDTDSVEECVTLLSKCI